MNTSIWVVAYYRGIQHLFQCANKMEAEEKIEFLIENDGVNFSDVYVFDGRRLKWTSVETTTVSIEK